MIIKPKRAIRSFFEEREDFFAAGSEKFGGEPFSKLLGFCGGAGGLAGDEVLALDVRYEGADFYFVCGDFCVGPYGGVTAALHCGKDFSLG